MTIYAASIDADGCFFHKDYLDTNHTDRQLIESNANLFDYIKGAATDATRKVLLFGSNRQSFEIDMRNSEPKGIISGFQAIHEIAKHLNDHGFEFDSILLIDLYNAHHTNAIMTEEARAYMKSLEVLVTANNEERHQKFGDVNTELDRLKAIFSVEPHFDESKVLLLYSQIQRLASTYPNEEIIFDFIDDKDEILVNLEDFFLCYPYLLPHNVTLRLKKYSGNYVVNGTLSDPIKGQGEIDYDYKKTVVDLANQIRPRDCDEEYRSVIGINIAVLARFQSDPRLTQIDQLNEQLKRIQPVSNFVVGSAVAGAGIGGFGSVGILLGLSLGAGIIPPLGLTVLTVAALVAIGYASAVVMFGLFAGGATLAESLCCSERNDTGFRRLKVD